jgi:hypothetical protein
VPAAAPGRLLQASHREPAYLAHRSEGVPRGAVEQPLGPVRRPVPDMLGDGPAVTFGCLAHYRVDVLACLQPRRDPDETRPHLLQQLSAFPDREPGPYAGSSSRLRFCCLHKRMIARRLRHVEPRPTALRQVKAPMAAAVLGATMHEHTARPTVRRAVTGIALQSTTRRALDNRAPTRRYARTCRSAGALSRRRRTG